jgi:hypothetical protein
MRKSARYLPGKWGVKKNKPIRNKTHFLPGLAFLVLSQLFLPSVASATDYYVSAGKGANSNSGASPNAAFGDLTYAMKKLHAGDTLYIREGTYTNVPSINLKSFRSGTQAAPIVVRPYLNEKPILSADKIVTILDVSWWVFQDLTFQATQEIRLGKRDYRTCISAAQNIVFQGNAFQHSNNHGIVINCAHQVLITNNTFWNIRSRNVGQDKYGILTSAVATDILISGNRFTDIGADGVQLQGVDLSNIIVANNEFEVVRPYRYRDENGNLDASKPQRFGNVGENAIDVKGGPGPITIVGNVIHGFRPVIDGVQDASGAMGVGITFHNGARELYLQKNHFYDNVIDVKISGQGNKSEIAYNVFENSVHADPAIYGDSQTPRGLHLENTSDVRVYNNVFHNADPTGKILLWVGNVSNVWLQNNVFHNGQMLADPKSSVLDFSGDYNAWSGITGKTHSNFLGLHDVPAGNLGIDWSNWKPSAGSPVVDAGMLVQKGLKTDYYGATMGGVSPDIGVAEFNGSVSDTPPGC